MVKLICASLAVMVVLVGCSTVYVPATPEGQACLRECMIVRNTCEIRCTGENAGFCSIGCAGQQKSCWRSCPGATEE